MLSLDPRGEPVRSPKAYTIAAEDPARVVEASGVGAVHLGHSMGGYVAQLLAAPHPALVRFLTLMSTSPGPGRPSPGDGPCLVGGRLAASGSTPGPHSPSPSGRAGRPFTRFGELPAAPAPPATSTERCLDQFRALLADGGSSVGRSVPTLVLHRSADRVVRPRRVGFPPPGPGCPAGDFEGAGHNLM
ncbi:MAG: alpha/beta fold hydrolase, partial [Acidimicrobiia bacterium]